MSTLAEITSALKLQYPTIRIGSDEDGYTDLSPVEYGAQISEWASNQLSQEKEIADQLAADKAISDARTSGITHAISLGFTQAQADAMFP